MHRLKYEKAGKSVYRLSSHLVVREYRSLLQCNTFLRTNGPHSVPYFDKKTRLPPNRIVHATRLVDPSGCDCKAENKQNVSFLHLMRCVNRLCGHDVLFCDGHWAARVSTCRFSAFQPVSMSRAVRPQIRWYGVHCHFLLVFKFPATTGSSVGGQSPSI